MNTYFEPKPITIYFQNLMKPLSKRFIYAAYANSLPLKRTDKMIEFGSGVGIMASILADKVDDGNLTCIDISKRYLKVVQKRLKSYDNVHFYNGTVNELNLPENGYDAVNIHFVLHDVPQSDRITVVEKLFEVLRPGGKIFLREPTNSAHGISTHEIKQLFYESGFVQLYEQEERIRFAGDIVTTCFSKISTMKFFFS